MFLIFLLREPAATSIADAVALMMKKFHRTIVKTEVKTLRINGTQAAFTSSQLLK